MKNIKRVLEILDKHDLHVHEMSDDYYKYPKRYKNYRRFKTEITGSNYDTHYIVHGDKIAHSGNLVTIESYVLGLENK